MRLFCPDTNTVCDGIVANLFTATRNACILNITQPYSAREKTEYDSFFTEDVSSGTILFNCYLLLICFKLLIFFLRMELRYFLESLFGKVSI